MNIYNLLLELQSFTPVDPETLENALNIKHNKQSEREFKQILVDWQNGEYDEDPGLAVSELELVILKTNS